jgi:rod shape-determining protein MreD
VSTAAWSRLDGWARKAVPLGTAILLVILSAVRIPIPGMSSVMPLLALGAVYYWTVYRPDLMGPLSVFCIGLTQDILSGAPLGLNALVLLLVHIAVQSQRRFFLGKPFVVIWWAFMMVSAGAALVGWAVASIYYASVISPHSALVQYVLTFSIYPALTWLFAQAQQALLKPNEAG